MGALSGAPFFMAAITILTSDPRHPCIPHLQAWCSLHSQTLAVGTDGLPGGDLLFAISCSEILRPEQRALYGACYVIHESDLPKGRGWSPLAWQILDGSNRIVLSLIEMQALVDTGPIVLQRLAIFEGHELYDEIHSKIALSKLALIDQFLKEGGMPKEQEGEPTYYPRRYPHQSELDVNLSIAEQFDLLRVCDPRFPAYFKHRGCTYTVTVTKS